MHDFLRGIVHAVPHHPAPHDLSLPASRSPFGEHRMMVHPRDSHHQRVVQADIKISPKPRSMRFVQDAFGNYVGIARFSRRSNELSFEYAPPLEHSPRRKPRPGRRRTGLPGRLSRHCRLRDLTPYVERQQQHDPMDEVGRWAWAIHLRQSGSIPALSRFSPRLSQKASITASFYRRRDAKGIQLPVETLRLTAMGVAAASLC